MTTKNLIILCTFLLICGILFWPTLYRYDTLKIGQYSTPLRINRITGYTERYTTIGWVSHEKNQSEKNQSEEVLPIEEQAKITGNASLSYATLSDANFSGTLYNGSDWTVTRIRLRLVPKNRDGSIIWDRKFNTSVTIEPLTTRYFSVSVTRAEGASNIDWYIDEVWGRKNN